MYEPTNGLKGIIGLISLAYVGFLVIKVATVIHATGSLDAESSLSYGTRILAFGGMVYASFAINAYRFSRTPVYYVMTALLMAQIGWYGYLKAMAVSNNIWLVAADQPPPIVVSGKPVQVSIPPPAPTHVAVVAAAAPPPPQPADNSPWPKDVPSGPVMITHDVSKYLNPDHVHTVSQPIPVPNMATAEETTNSATASH